MMIGLDLVTISNFLKNGCKKGIPAIPTVFEKMDIKSLNVLLDSQYFISDAQGAGTNTLRFIFKKCQQKLEKTFNDKEIAVI